MSLPLYGPDEALLPPVMRALSQAEVKFTVHRDLDAFVVAMQSCDASVMVVRWLEDLGSTALRRSAALPNWIGLIVVTDPQPENLRHIVELPAAAVLFMDRDLHRLVPTLYDVRSRSAFKRWGVKVKMRTDLPRLLRRALLAALEHDPLLTPAEAGDPALPPRSVRALATRLECSEDHLGELARSAGVDLPGFLKWSLAMRALQLHRQHGTTWEAVAWRLGFQSVSGLSEHLHHALGVRPRSITNDELDRWFGAFERRFLGERNPEVLK